MRKLVLLLIYLVPATVIAQEMADPDEHGSKGVFVKNDYGVIIGRVIPTPQFALNAIQEQKEWGKLAAIKILNQMDEPRSPAELDAFADDLGRLILESSSKKVARDALGVLWSASYPSDSPPYERGLEILIDVYEIMDGTEAVSTGTVLGTIFHTGTRGKAYLIDLFTSSKPPEKPCWLQPQGVPKTVDGQYLNKISEPPKEEWCPYKTQWCEVGSILVRRGIKEVDPALVFPICDKRVPEGGIWPDY